MRADRNTRATLEKAGGYEVGSKDANGVTIDMYDDVHEKSAAYDERFAELTDNEELGYKRELDQETEHLIALSGGNMKH